jgi:peptide/nickel transport system substrate-binding protein
MAPNPSAFAKAKKISKIWMLAFSVLTLLSLVAAACGEATPPKASGPSFLNIVDSPRGEFTSNFNPFVNHPNTSRTGTYGFLYEPLVFVNRFTAEEKPWLASSYTLAKDATSISFTIRQGVKWNDGQAFTAEDVLFTFNVLKNIKGADQVGIWSDVVKEMSSPDANTVLFTFKQPVSTAVWLFSQVAITPKHSLESLVDPSNPDKLLKATNDKPVATGPYTLKSFTSALYVYAKNPTYWQAGKPEIDELRFPAVKDNSTANLMLTKGEVDWAGIGWDPKLDVNFTTKDPKNNHHWFAATNTVMLYLNLTKAPFNSVDVRQAMSLAINRQQLQDKAAPYAAPANPSAVLTPAPSHNAYLASDYQNAKFTQDLAKANDLMVKAGYAKGSDGFYAKDGKKVSFKLMVVNGWSDWQSSTQLIADDLKKLGLDAQIDTVADFAPYFSSLQLGNFDAAISWTDQGPTPYFPFYNLLASVRTADIGKEATATNWGRWKDAATDQYLKQYLASTDPAVQKQAMAGIQKIMVEQVPAIPLDYNVGWYEYRTARATGWPDKDNAYATGSPYNSFDPAYIVLQLKPVK